MAKVQAARRVSGFNFPKDVGAWWTFCLTVCAGLTRVAAVDFARMGKALALTGVMASFFLLSDWISSLVGRGIEGRVDGGNPKAWQAWVLAAAGLACGLGFIVGLEPRQLHFWLVCLAAVACLSGWMFLLRLEMVSLDLRLLALSSLLCTLPALLLGFLAWGPGSPQSFYFWFWPAVYFPVGAVYVRAWVLGAAGPRRRITWLAVPLLLLAFTAFSVGAFVAAGLLLVFAARMIAQLVRRYVQGSAGLPYFQDLRQLGWEQAAWNLLMAAVWLGATATSF